MQLTLVSSYMAALKVLHKITSFIKTYLIMYNYKVSVIHSFCSKGIWGLLSLWENYYIVF